MTAGNFPRRRFDRRSAQQMARALEKLSERLARIEATAYYRDALEAIRQPLALARRAVDEAKASTGAFLELELEGDGAE